MAVLAVVTALVVLVVKYDLIETKQKYLVKSYTNYQAGFSIGVPTMVKSRIGNIETNPLVPLNIYEERDAVYFSTETFKDTLENSSWDLKISTVRLKSKSEVLPYLKSIYGINGCNLEMNEFEEGAYDLILSPKDPTLSHEDPNSCFIDGTVRSVYYTYPKRVTTFKVKEPFFYLEKGPVSEEVLETFKFTPAISP